MKSTLSNSSNFNNSADLQDSIAPLFRSSKSANGKQTINKKYAALKKANIETYHDLLQIFPHSIIKTPPISTLDKCTIGKQFHGLVKLQKLVKKRNFKSKKFFTYNLSLLVCDSSGDSLIHVFNAYPGQISFFEKNTQFHFIGEPSYIKSQVAFANPLFFSTQSRENDVEETSIIPHFLFHYPTINGVNGTEIKKLIDKTFKIIDMNNTVYKYNYLPESILKKYNFFETDEIFLNMHGRNFSANTSQEDIETTVEKTRKQLIYGEFFYHQVKFRAKKLLLKEKQVAPINVSNDYLTKIINTLPFKLTYDQRTVIDEIIHDFKSNHPMSRLLQGDVGSGKTVVAYMAAIIMAPTKQVALMCPTEALAKQHFQTFISLNKKLPAPFQIEILLGGEPGYSSNEKRNRLKTGEINIIIGTHSLIQDKVSFNNLGLVIIDEQHKFGVGQRTILKDKSETPHALYMSATPIPRTIEMLLYGDLDISIIKNFPYKKKITTRIITNENYSNFLNFIKTRLSIGEQIYVVAAAIEKSENEDLNLLHLKQIHERFNTFFPEFNVQILHGKMKSEEKESILNSFRNNQIKILLSTTVIEVGIDVHNASTIVIMNPERFGLSQMHQLRGRVGRGNKAGFCFLVNEQLPEEVSLLRQKILESTIDGFEIAEQDYKNRGGGNIFGVDQSGVDVAFQYASTTLNYDLLLEAKSDISSLYEKNDRELLSIIEKEKLIQNSQGILS